MLSPKAGFVARAHRLGIDRESPSPEGGSRFGSGSRPGLVLLALYARVRWQLSQIQPSVEAEAGGIADGR